MSPKLLQIPSFPSSYASEGKERESVHKKEIEKYWDWFLCRSWVTFERNFLHASRHHSTNIFTFSILSLLHISQEGSVSTHHSDKRKNGISGMKFLKQGTLLAAANGATSTYWTESYTSWFFGLVFFVLSSARFLPLLNFMCLAFP